MAELFEAVKAALQDGDSAALEVMEASWAESDDECTTKPCVLPSSLAFFW